jgi:hypothetical protein
MFKTGLHFPFIVVLNSSELFWSVDWLVVEDAIQFKGELERRDEDVKFGVDGIGSVEAELKTRKEQWQLFLKPSFELRDPSALGLMRVSPFSAAGLGAKIMLGSLDLAKAFRKWILALFAIYFSMVWKFNMGAR